MVRLSGNGKKKKKKKRARVLAGKMCNKIEKYQFSFKKMKWKERSDYGVNKQKSMQRMLNGCQRRATAHHMHVLVVVVVVVVVRRK